MTLLRVWINIIILIINIINFFYKYLLGLVIYWSYIQLFISYFYHILYMLSSSKYIFGYAFISFYKRIYHSYNTITNPKPLSFTSLKISNPVKSYNYIHKLKYNVIYLPTYLPTYLPSYLPIHNYIKWSLLFSFLSMIIFWMI